MTIAFSSSRRPQHPRPACEGEILAWWHAHVAAQELWVTLNDTEWNFSRHEGPLAVSGSFVGSDADACTPCALTQSNPAHEAADPLRPPPRVRTLRAGA